jgi:LmbE family N-acetylglucosaminyl deacetylase
MKESKKILSVLAHPDDETFGMGGTLAFYASQGVEVHLICATKGEAGDVTPELLKDYDSIADRRESELRCAADTLGLKKVTFLGYRDSGMNGSKDNQNPNAFINAPFEEVVGKIVSYIRDFKPDVVLTFDPVGGYHHPDHIYIQKATVAAFEAASDAEQYPQSGPPFQPKKLYYHLFPRGFVRFAVRAYKLLGKDPTRFGRNHDINLEKLAGDADYPIHVKINYRKVDHLKEKASNCHESQLDFDNQSPLVLKIARYLVSGTDSYMQAYPPVPDDYRQTDLFA